MPSPLPLEERVAYLEGRADEYTEVVKSLRGDMASLRQEMGDLRREMGDLRQHTDAELTALRQELKEDIRALRQHTDGLWTSLRDEMNRRFEALEHKADRRFMWLVGVQVATFVAIIGAFIPLYVR